jgi:hypothetical protein
MRFPIVATALVALGLSNSPVLATAPPSPNIPCQMPGSDTATFLSVDDLPLPIKRELARSFNGPGGGLAARDADFRESDFTAPSDTSLPFARFVQAGHAGTRWYVWYELRGPRKEFESLIYYLPAGNSDPTFVAAQSVWPVQQLCPETQRHIIDARVAPANQTIVDLSPGVACTIPGRDAQIFHSLADMALPVRQALGDMAERDAPFQETDVIDGDQPLSLRRFIQGGHSGTYWYVWYEHGGMGLSYNIAYFDLPAGTGKVRKMWQDGALTVSELCPVTVQLLAARGR